ncbi:MAG: hypothetical protein EBZ05_06570 [Verrucomicrobia bacterium]|nr:hypothetical protein [Verrucomicrobiota bacterium]
MKVVLSIIWLSVFGITFCPASGMAEALTPMQIAAKARDKDQENFRKYGTTPCRLEEIKEELNEKGMVEEREVRIHRMAASAAPSPGGKETERISPEMHKKKPNEDSSILDRIQLFDWRLEAEDDSQGEPCYRLAFTPREGAKALGGRDEVIAKTSGRCWVAKTDFSKIRLEGRLTQPVEVMGFLVTVREVDFLTTARRLAQGIAAPQQVRYRFRVEVFPVFEFHERHTQKFEFGDAAKSMASSMDQKGGMAGLK